MTLRESAGKIFDLVDRSLGFLFNWLRSRNLSSHGTAALVTFLVSEYLLDPSFSKYVNQLLANHPKTIALLGAFCSFWMKYSSAHSAYGHDTLYLKKGKKEDEVR